MRRSPATTCALAALLGALALPALSQRAQFPEAPSRPVDILAEVDGAPIRGHISDRRTTHDGRLQVTKGRLGTELSIVRPEVFRRHLLDEPRTTDGPAVVIDPSTLHRSEFEEAIADHAALCDPYLDSRSSPNPYACSSKGRDADCYDVSLLQLVQQPEDSGRRLRTELWSTPVTVTVNNPKTTRAAIAQVVLRGEPQRSPIRRTPRRAGEFLFEPMTTSDGRLLLVNSGDTLLYSVMRSSDAACDARNWTELRHLSEAPNDPDMQRYGIARYPMRDSLNRRIKPGQPVRGAYPWIDRAGKNLFFMHVATPGLFYLDGDGRMQTRFDVLNPLPEREIDPEAGNASRFGMATLGLWTQGKIVLPDRRVNAIDFHTGARRYYPELRLYDTEPTNATLERSAITHINSAESEWNYLSTFLGRSPRDVAWFVTGSNGMSDEVVFDDALTIGTLIWAPMNAPVNPATQAWHDGFDARKRRGYIQRPRIQNAAAAETQWKLPGFGALVGARVEPVAAGGIVGKGLWLGGETGRLEFKVPRQPREAAMRDATWTTTIWIDPRASAGRRRLLSFPDDSWVDVADGSLFIGSGSGSGREVVLPTALGMQEGAWTHLGFVSEPERLEIHVGGLRLTTIEGSWLRPRSGHIAVGVPRGGLAEGFRGWVDELRVVSGAQSPEQLCNYSHGTLRGLRPGQQPNEFALAGSYPQATHDDISAVLEAAGHAAYPRYRCEQVRGPRAPCLDDIHRTKGADASCVRQALLFPEGPLFFDAPRPDSRRNAFCLSCHAAENRSPSLQISAALRAGSAGSSLSDDPRRQPLQAPARLHGVIPAELLDLRDDVIAPPEGFLLDRLLYPARRATGPTSRRPR